MTKNSFEINEENMWDLAELGDKYLIKALLNEVEVPTSFLRSPLHSGLMMPELWLSSYTCRAIPRSCPV
jgi:hypothetical protein